jgi:lipopolysaccharide export system permease protein
MRILDRQRYWAYLKAYMICFTALVGLYIVIDAFSNFDEFTKRETSAVALARIMGRYYFVHMSEFYDRLCGVIGMMAAIFTVTWMQRNNELLAMLAAGISTQRVIRPVIVSAVIVSALAIVNQEMVMPEFAEELQKSHADDGTDTVNVASRYDANGILVHGAKAVRQTRTVLGFNATIPIEVSGAMHELVVKQATYIPESDKSSPLRGGWLLRGASIEPPFAGEPNENAVLVKLKDANGFPPPFRDLGELGGDTYFLKTTLTFAAITRRGRWYQYAPTSDLIRGLTDPANEPEKMDIAVFLHNRMIRPLLSLALLFLSLPQVLGGYGRNMFVGLGLSLGTAALFYGLVFVSQFLGSHYVIPPELSAWAPLIGFGTVSVIRWDAIRT